MEKVIILCKSCLVSISAAHLRSVTGIKTLDSKVTLMIDSSVLSYFLVFSFVLSIEYISKKSSNIWQTPCCRQYCLLMDPTVGFSSSRITSAWVWTSFSGKVEVMTHTQKDRHIQYISTYRKMIPSVLWCTLYMFLWSH